MFTVLDAQDGVDQLMDIILRGQLAGDIVFKPAGFVLCASQVVTADIDDVAATTVQQDFKFFRDHRRDQAKYPGGIRSTSYIRTNNRIWTYSRMWTTYTSILDS